MSCICLPRRRATSGPIGLTASSHQPLVLAAWALLLLAGLAPACVTVKPVVLDRKTQLENQVLGTFQRLEQDLILASSVRGSPAQTRLSPLEQEALAAMMTRAYLRDDIEALKDKQVLGEAKSGLLEILALPGDAAEARRAEQLAAEENRSRQILFQRVISLSRELSAQDLSQVQHIFYRLNTQAAAPGQKVQLESGKWRVIPRPPAGASTRNNAGGQPAGGGKARGGQ